MQKNTKTVDDDQGQQIVRMPTWLFWKYFIVILLLHGTVHVLALALFAYATYSLICESANTDGKWNTPKALLTLDWVLWSFYLLGGVLAPLLVSK